MFSEAILNQAWHKSAIPPRSLRDWARRFAAWACVLALAFNALTPMAHAAAMERAAAQSVEFICHATQLEAGTDQQGPASNHDDQDHCPLCVLFTSHAVAVSTEIGAPLPLPLPALLGHALVIPATSDTLVPSAESRPFNPRAPPVSA